jgi:hypothetical protein
MNKLYAIGMLICVAFLAGCEAEVGSADWCTDMDEKPKADWTANEAADYTQNCLFKSSQ